MATGIPRPTSGTTEERRLEELERTLDSLRDDSEVAHVLLGLASALAEVRTVDETLERTVKIVPEAFGADRCFAATWDAQASRFRIRAHFGFDDRGAELLYRLAEEPAGPAFLHETLEGRRPLLVADAAEDELSSEERAARGIGAYVGIPLIRLGEEFGVLGVEFASPRALGAREEALARGVGRQVGVALSNARRFNLLNDLRSAGLRIGSHLRLQRVVAELAAASAELTSASSAAVYFLDSGQGTLAVTGGHSLPASLARGLARIDLDREPWSRLLADGYTLVEDLGAVEGLSGVEASAALAVVPSPEGQVIGAVAAFFDRPVVLDRDVVEAFRVLTAQGGNSLENARRFERQRRVARSLVSGIASTDMPAFKGCTVGAVYEPASEESDVGGDYFDAFETNDGNIAMVVGDVSGKGAEAAAQTAIAKYMLRAFATRNAGPSSVLFHLNNALVRTFTEDRFTTLVYLLFDPEERVGQLAVAGHPLPLVYRAESRTVETAAVEGGILGAFNDQHYEQKTLELSAGDVFLAYTDGLVETRSNDELYGIERVRESFLRHASHAGAGPQDVAQGVYADAHDFGSMFDDTVVFAMMRTEA